MSKMHLFSVFNQKCFAFVSHTTENFVILFFQNNNWWQVPKAIVSMGTRIKVYFKYRFDKYGKIIGVLT